MTSTSDDELIGRAQAGDLRAFGLLVDRHQNAVRGFLRRLLGNKENADDLAQEGFVRAMGRLQKVGQFLNFRNYVCGIAYRLVREHYRSDKRRKKREETNAELSAMERPEGLDLDLYLSLRQALDALPAEQRAVVALCLGAEFSHDEAAQVLGIPAGTVKSHLARGRSQLRAALGEAPPEAADCPEEEAGGPHEN